MRRVILSLTLLISLSAVIVYLTRLPVVRDAMSTDSRPKNADAAYGSDGGNDEVDVDTTKASASPSEDLDVIEGDLAARGLGNLKVFEFPSEDPEYYKRKMYETDSIVPDPDYLKDSPRPVVFREYIYGYLREPLNTHDLAFLEEKLGKSEDDEVKLQCAVLLYRYGQSEGEAYLASRFEGADRIVAATVLALNKESKYLPQILETLLAESAAVGESDFHRMSVLDPLLYAISTWRDPKIGEAVLELASRAEILTPGMLCSIVGHQVYGAQAAVERLQKQYNDDVSVSYHLATMYGLTGDEAYLSEIADRVQDAFTEMQSNDADTVVLGTLRCTYVIDALGMMASTSNTRMLRDMISRLIALPEGLNLPVGYVSGRPLDDLVAKTVIALANTETSMTSDVANSLVSGLEYLPDDSNVRLGVAMTFDTNAFDQHLRLRDAVGNSAIARSIELRQLNILPVYFLPDSSVYLLAERTSMYPPK